MSRRKVFAGSGLVFLSLSLIASALGQVTPAQLLSLSDAIAMARVDNPDVKLGVANRRGAAANLLAARASFLPKITASEGFADSTDPVFAFGARLRQGRFTAADFSPTRLNAPGATSDFISTAGGSWTLFDSGRSLGQVRGARANLGAVQHDNEATNQRIELLTISAYYRALLSDQNVIATESAVARAQAFAKQAHDRVDAGVALLSDAMQADVDRSLREQDVAEAESNSALAYTELAAVLGDPSKKFTIVTPVGTPDEMQMPLAELGLSALKQKPDLLALRGRVEAARQNARASRSAYGPQVSSFANVQADNPHLLGGGQTNWTVGAKVELQIFDGGVRRADLAKADAAFDAAAATLKQAEIQAGLDVQRAFYARQTASRQFAISADLLKKSQETLRTFEDRYGAGLVTASEVLLAQEQLRDVELARARSLHRWWIADAELQLATGTGQLKGVNP